MQRLPRGGLSETRAASDAARRAAGRAMAAAEEANKVTKSTPQQAGLAPAEGAGTRRAAGAAQQVRERMRVREGLLGAPRGVRSACASRELGWCVSACAKDKVTS